MDGEREKATFAPVEEAHVPEDLDRLHCWLRTFVEKNAHIYHFESVYQSFVHRIIDDFIVQSETTASIRSEYILVAFQALRILLREARFLDDTKLPACIPPLCTHLRVRTNEHLEGNHEVFGTEILVEILGVLRKLVSRKELCKQFELHGAPAELASLLQSRDAFVLQTSLSGITKIASTLPITAEQYFAEPTVLSNITLAIQGTSEPVAIAALEAAGTLVAGSAKAAITLCCESGVLPRILLLLQARDSMVRNQAAYCLFQISCHVDCKQSIQASDGTRAIVERLRAITSNSGGQVEDLAAPAVYLCNTVAELSRKEQIAVDLRILGVHVVLIDLLSSDLVSSTAHRSIDKNVALAAVRAVRFLFATERNRRHIRKVLPQRFLLPFARIGSFVDNIDAYKPLLGMLPSLREDIQAREHQAQRIRKDSDHTEEALARQWQRGQEQPTTYGVDVQPSTSASAYTGEIDEFRIGPYVVVDVVGKGAFGRVYQARTLHGNATYALKELANDIEGTEIGDGASSGGNEENATLHDEICILQQMQHPNIVRYFSSFEHQGRLYIVMEYVKGPSLGEYVASRREQDAPLDEESIWRIFVQLCQAIHYLHTEVSVVHRDLSPANILLEEGDVVKVADFGLARQLIPGASLMTSVVGTISYSCPEIVKHEKYSKKADIWSLGCVLYQMITLRPPFLGSNPISVAKRIVEGDYDPIPVDRVSDLLRETVARMLCVNPGQRPSIEEVCQRVTSKLMHAIDETSIALEAARAQVRALENAARSQSGRVGSGRARQLFAQTPSESGNANVVDRSIRLSVTPPRVSISPRKLRPLSDPCAEILATVAKIEFVIAFAARTERDVRVRIIERFHRHLFFESAGRELSLKESLHKLLEGSPDPIEIDSLIATRTSVALAVAGTASIAEQAGGAASPAAIGGTLPPSPQQVAARRPSRSARCPPSPARVAVRRMTYAQLRAILEELLVQNGYYT